MTTAHTSLTPFLTGVRDRAVSACVFGEVKLLGSRLQCAAAYAGDEAWYRLDLSGGKLWVSLVTPGRYLSQSIESDLVHTGDKLHDLLHDELIDQGVSGEAAQCGPVEHFRSEDKLFTFRTVVPVDVSRTGEPASIDLAARYLLAMQACFAPLGDMSAGEGE